VLTHDLLLKEVLGFAAGNAAGCLDPARAVSRQWRAAVERWGGFRGPSRLPRATPT
jgi:hypothetical protein